MAAAGAPSADAGLHDQQEDGLTTSSTGEEDSECPLCKFIEAGPCALPHKEWVRCRTAAEAKQVDYVTECQEQFKVFFNCMIQHSHYHQPFLDMFGIPIPDEHLEQASTQTTAAK